MVYTFLALFLFQSAFAQFWGLGKKKSERDRQWNTYIDEFKQLEVKANSEFQEKFHSVVKKAEDWIDQEKLKCRGESVQGEKVLNSKQEQQECFALLKTKYENYLEIVFDLKKKLLNEIHEAQISELDKDRQELLQNLHREI